LTVSTQADRKSYQRKLIWTLTILLAVGLSQEVLRKTWLPYPWVQLPVVGVGAVIAIASTLFAGRQKDVWSSITECSSIPVLCLSATLAIGIVAGIGNGNSIALLLLGLVAPGAFAIGASLGRRLQWPLPTAAIVIPLLVTTFGIGHFLEFTVTDYTRFPSLGSLAPKRPWIRTWGADQFRMLSGFFRSPDIAGLWMAVTAMISHGLALSNRKRGNRWLWITLSALALTACVLSGRRKMQLIFVVGSFVMLSLLAMTRRWSQLVQQLLGFGLILVVSAGVSVWITSSDHYAEYAHSSSHAITERFVKETIFPVLQNANEITWLGNGLGSMAPGAQHVGVKWFHYSEGGLVRVMFETGWIGLSLFLIGTASIFWRILTTTIHNDCSTGQVNLIATSLAVGLFAAFLIGQQSFGDPAIAILCGAVVGVAGRRSEPVCRGQ
jgi:hypothetical protein